MISDPFYILFDPSLDHCGVPGGGFGHQDFGGGHDSCGHGCTACCSYSSPLAQFCLTSKTSANNFVSLVGITQQRKAVGVRQVRAALDLILPHAHSKDLLDSLDSHIETSSRPTPKNAPKIEPRPMRNDLFAYQFKHLSKPKLGRYFTLAPAANTLIAVAVQQVVLLVLEGGVTNMKWDIRKSLMPEDLMMSIWHNDLLSELFHNTLLASTGVPCGFPNAPKHKPTKPLAKETEAAEPFKPIVPQ